MAKAKIDPQGSKTMGKHGGKMGQHPKGGTNHGGHVISKVGHPRHAEKMCEG